MREQPPLRAQRLVVKRPAHAAMQLLRDFFVALPRFKQEVRPLRSLQAGRQAGGAPGVWSPYAYRSILGAPFHKCRALRRPCPHSRPKI